VVRGTRANKFRDGILAMNNRNAEAIVRTSVQHAASVARQQTWEQNSGVVKAVRWVSTLDGRTSSICRSLDNKVFPLDAGPRPPIHIRCRSTTVAELDGRFDFLKEGATRSSLGGTEKADTSYYGWLKKQPVAFQNEVLGINRAKLLRDGGLTAERFAELNLGKNFKPLTLAQMKRLEPQAFEKASL
jgi:SPP1 gp7 family putative phage head morphogenesis protein